MYDATSITTDEYRTAGLQSGPLPRGEIFLKCGEIVGNHQRLQVIDIDLWLCYP